MNLNAKLQKPQGISGRITGEKKLTAVMQPSGKGVVSDYNALTNKPSIEGVELVGNRQLEEIGVNEATAQEILDIFEEV